MLDAARQSYRPIVRCLVGLSLVLVCTAEARAAQPAVGLGTATSFAVLGGSTVTNTGPTVVNGDLGVSPGASIVGFPAGLVNGSVHAADAVATQAQSDLTAAYDEAAGSGPAVLLPADVGGRSLTAGVYRSASALGLTGDLTFDAQGDPDAVFIVQVATALTTASNSRVLLVGGAQACNVFWQIGSSATLGTATAFTGVILSRQSITLNIAASIQGRVLARGGAVTLDSNSVNRPTCTTATPAGPGAPAPPNPGAGSTTTAQLTTAPAKVADTVGRTGTSKCVDGRFKAIVRGAHIRSVTFLVDGHSIAIQHRTPFAATVALHHGTHRLRAHVVFSDGSRSQDVGFRFRVCTRQARRVRPAPSFTG